MPRPLKKSILGDSTIVLCVVRIFVKQMLYVHKRVNSEQVSSLNFIQQKLGTYLENEALQKVKVFKKMSICSIKCASKMIFFNEKKKIILDMKN